jgi:hypothetical protein
MLLLSDQSTPSKKVSAKIEQMLQRAKAEIGLNKPL